MQQAIFVAVTLYSVPLKNDSNNGLPILDGKKLSPYSYRRDTELYR